MAKVFLNQKPAALEILAQEPKFTIQIMFLWFDSLYKKKTQKVKYERLKEKRKID